MSESMKEKEKVFYVYVDRTEDRDENPEDRRGRVFYVGKGDDSRIRLKKRNTVWHRITNKYGSQRDILFATRDEQYALQYEIELILKYNTFIYSNDTNAWGANLTAGGEGTSGKPCSEETKQKISEAMIGKLAGKKNPRYGKKLTDETKRKISEKATGRKQNLTDEQRQQRSARMTGANHPLFGKPRPESVKQKLREANLGKKQPESQRKKHSEAMSGENSPVTNLTNQKVIEIRAKYATGLYTYKELAKEYEVSKGCIGPIIRNKTWKGAK